MFISDIKMEAGRVHRVKRFQSTQQQPMAVFISRIFFKTVAEPGIFTSPIPFTSILRPEQRLTQL